METARIAPAGPGRLTRRALTLAAAGLLAGSLGSLVGRDAAARNRKRDRRQHNRNKSNATSTGHGGAGGAGGAGGNVIINRP